MSNNDVTCAICGTKVYLDDDRVSVLGTHKLINDKDQQDDYALHRDCWYAVTEGWCEPI